MTAAAATLDAPGLRPHFDTQKKANEDTVLSPRFYSGLF